MSLNSDLTIVAERLRPVAISEKTLRLNETVRQTTASTPPWWEVGAERHQAMRLNGETTVVKPKYLPQCQDFTIPSRDAGREIPCRVCYPSKGPPKGLLLFIHGGGWCFMSEKTSDPFLQFYSDLSGCATVSVGYRLAPQHPFPAGPEDCYDAANHLLQESERMYGGPLMFIAGESAGAHLAMLMTFQLLRGYPTFQLSGGLIMHFGIFDLSLLPSLYTLRDPPALTHEMMQHYVDAFTPGMGLEERKSSAVSPLYERMEDFRQDGKISRLPRALFTCGTMDPLLDDTAFMGTKWMMAGGEAIVRFYEGAHHGFNGLAPEESREAARVAEDVEVFIRSRLNS